MKQAIAQDSNGVTVGYDYDARSLYCSFTWGGAERTVYDADFDGEGGIPLYARILMEQARRVMKA